MSNGTKLWETSGVVPIRTTNHTYGPSRYCYNSGPGEQCVEMFRTWMQKDGDAVGYAR
jgi:hypothetical protein